MSWRIAKISEKKEICSFFNKMNDEVVPPFSALPNGINASIEYIYKFGRLFVTSKNNEIKGILGYFIGVPEFIDNILNISSDSIAYIYFIVIDEKYRGRLTYELIPVIGEQALNDKLKTIKFKSHKHEKTLNRFYSTIAEKTSEEINAQGVVCYEYTALAENWKNKKLWM